MIQRTAPLPGPRRAAWPVHPFAGLVALVLACVLAAGGAGAREPDAKLLARVKRVLDTRCVTCHACYNAPCQLDLTAWEGLDRGASKNRVYDGFRITPAPPTRLFVDALDAREWQAQHEFFPVTRPLGPGPATASVMGRMLVLKHSAPRKEVAHTPQWMCPAGRAGMAVYAGLGRDGMPLGFPALPDEDHALLMTWLHGGAALPAPVEPVIDPGARPQLAEWEAFLNADGPRHRLVARYVYEHLFLAHLYFESHPAVFFRLVRSRTAAPEPIEEIPTVRPYDAPGVARVHYRFRRLTGTLVHKTHITFPLSPARLARYRDWFLGGTWLAGAPLQPGYAPDLAANPFRTFKAIPAVARYRFFLDNARYFVMSFIRGPVCEGQMAVNVINDHFQVLFLDPESDLSVTDPSYLAGADELLTLPATGRSDPFKSYYLDYKARQRRYTAYRESGYARAFPGGAGVGALWDGSGTERDAMLTVFRHFDNAAVVHGARGGTPKTAWVMDYPIFERIYYLLVAGFNVYGNAFHQASTRLYMDNLRVESEDLFLSFLPSGARRGLRESWYRGMLAELKMENLNPLRGAHRPTAVPFTSADPKSEFLALARAHLGGAVIQPEPLLNVPQRASANGETSTRDDVARALNRLTLTPAPFVGAMPDLTYLIVDFDDASVLYSLIRNQAHTNVSFLLQESERRLPEEDSLVILDGVAGSYPNFLVRMRAGDVARFVAMLERWTGSEPERRALAREFGVSRHRADFWRHFDALNALARRAEGVGGAILDLSKYDHR